MYHADCKVEFQPFNRSYSQLMFSTFYIKMNVKSQKAVYRLVTVPQGGTHKSTSWLLPTILHADWSNRPRTAFRRWTQAVHQVVAIHVGRHRFLACPYRFLAAKRQAKAEIFPRAIRKTELPSNPSPLTFRNHQIQILQTSSTHATMAANVSQQDTNTHGTG